MDKERERFRSDRADTESVTIMEENEKKNDESQHRGERIRRRW